MAEKYTYADVIIDPEDPRVEVGKEYYFANTPKQALEFANANGRGAVLIKVDTSRGRYPFCFENFIESVPCIIRKKETEKKYVPFDLTKEEDKAKFRGAWIRHKNSGREHIIEGLFLDEDPPYVVVNEEGYSPYELLEDYEFVDGSPCGKLVEVK